MLTSSLRSQQNTTLLPRPLSRSSFNQKSAHFKTPHTLLATVQTQPASKNGKPSNTAFSDTEPLPPHPVHEELTALPVLQPLSHGGVTIAQQYAQRPAPKVRQVGTAQSAYEGPANAQMDGPIVVHGQWQAPVCQDIDSTWGTLCRFHAVGQERPELLPSATTSTHPTLTWLPHPSSAAACLRLRLNAFPPRPGDHSPMLPWSQCGGEGGSHSSSLRPLHITAPRPSLPPRCLTPETNLKTNGSELLLV
nr:hypothetical protein Iba_chr06cCG7390 [Ipomoea batatas]